ncbi:hypothetical protein [Flaviaesturariibacter amylovorans]|uniref:Uncharacterized protein n=1 Tax=Flaviaesturariibacter amylovorans TaxID=1084520 RepID=A0ABP8HSY0_9BACT
MKSTFFLTAAVLAFNFASAQEPVVPAPASDSAAAQAAVAAPAASAQVSATATAQAPALPRGASTVDSIAAKYKLQPMPEALTMHKIFPAVGTYQLNSTSGAASDPVTVTLDSTSKGTIWISGMPQGTFKAYLVKRPATYRIVSQKSASGKAIPEGTLYFAPETNTLNIALGAYSAADPTAIFPVAVAADPNAIASAQTAEVKVKVESKKSKSKTKAKVQFFTATKVDPTTLQSTNSNAAYDQLLQQQQQQ